jgi:hypothetical protein
MKGAPMEVLRTLSWGRIGSKRKTCALATEQWRQRSVTTQCDERLATRPAQDGARSPWRAEGLPGG